MSALTQLGCHGYLSPPPCLHGDMAEGGGRVTASLEGGGGIKWSGAPIPPL